MTRTVLDNRMKMLISELAEMGSLVEKQLHDSIEAFKNKDMDLVDKVMKN
ncbi:MAG: PhoU domain-containing protein, partial [Clostridium sp.]